MNPDRTPAMSPDKILRLAHAHGRALRRLTKHPMVLVGRDTRATGDMIESALQSGFASAGADVVLLGTLPAPGVAYLTRALRASLGVAIGSRAGAGDDSGLAFFDAQGARLARTAKGNAVMLRSRPAWERGQRVGKTRPLGDAAGRYVEFCKSTFAHGITLKGLAVVVDAGHGAAHEVAPQVFRELGAEVTAMGCEPDGLNIDDGVGAGHPQAMAAAVAARHADFGVAVDGDGACLGIADAQGRLYGGDELLYVLAADRLERGEKVPGVVGADATNLAIEMAMNARGVQMVRTSRDAGDARSELVARGWLLGADAGGQILVLDQQTTGDALVNALQVLGAVLASGKSLSHHLEGVRLFARVGVELPLRSDRPWHESPVLAASLREARAELGAFGRIVVRADARRRLLHVVIEARDAPVAHRIARRIARTWV
jgi:phosphoglucosamine mutase